MSSQIDWVTPAQTANVRPFRDIRNQRQSVAEQKAELSLTLGRLCARVPPSIRDGSVNLVREWRATRAAASKVAGNSRSSVHDLTAAISNMQRYE